MKDAVTAFIALISTSLICIARSTADGGNIMATSSGLYSASHPTAEKRTDHLFLTTGHMMCRLQRDTSS